MPSPFCVQWSLSLWLARRRKARGRHFDRFAVIDCRRDFRHAMRQNYCDLARRGQSNREGRSNRRARLWMRQNPGAGRL